MIRDRTVTLCVGDRQVTGEITHLHFNDITMGITSPFSGVSAGWHIPYFALEHRKYESMDGVMPTARFRSRCVSSAQPLVRRTRAALDRGRRTRAPRGEGKTIVN